MKTQITLIGKNSKIYKSISNDLLKYFSIIEKSHNDDLSDASSIAIIFSVDKKDYNNNIILLDRIKNSKIKKVILISSVSVLVVKSYKYKYPSIKLLQEKYVKDKFNNYLIIRLSTFIDNISSDRKPYAIFFNKTLINTIIQNSNQKKVNKVLTLVDEISLKKPNLYINFYLFILKLIGFKIMRIIDIFLKIFSNLNYGYALLSYLELRKDHIKNE